MKYEDYFDVSNPNEWFQCLENYQQSTLTEMGMDTMGYDVVAQNWLNSNTSYTAQFGTGKKQNVFLDNIKREVVKFICDERAYSEEKGKLKEQAALSRTLIISTMSAAIATVVGSNAVLITPVIVLVLMSFGKIVKNAFCTTHYHKIEEELKE